MKENPEDILSRCHQVTESVKRNLHLLENTNPKTVEIFSLVSFNSRIVLSGQKDFLEAVKKEIGGEIIDDTTIGPFLYYGESMN